MYPCAYTQAEGEFGFNTNIFYKIPKKSFLLGGKYGTKLNLNFIELIVFKEEHPS